MNAPPQKDWLDIAIDFFFGAAFVDFWIVVGFLRAAKLSAFAWHPFWNCLVAATCIAGSLAALYRNQFWAKYETYSILPPMEESVSSRGKIVLWTIFGLGCASLALLIW